MIKVGVVGLGAMGQHHARIYSELSKIPRHCEPDRLPKQSNINLVDSSNTRDSGLTTPNPQLPEVQLVGLADADSTRAKELGEKYAVSHFSSHRDLLGKVDAVSVAVPTTLHHSVVMDFLESGAHVLVEKPIAFSLEEASDMIATARKNNLKLAVGHIERFNPAVIKLKEVIDQGLLGKLLIVSTRRVGPAVPRIRDVGVVIDSATHDIGVVKYLIGKNPASVFSRTGSLKHPKEDHAVIMLDFEGTIACLEVNWFTPHKVRTLTVTGSEGIAYLDYIKQSLVVHTDNLLKSQNSSLITVGDDIVTNKVEPLKTEIQDFLNAIRIDGEPAVSGLEGKAILKIALESNHNNYCISPFDEILNNKA
jgi:UDP-N-acetylglucosamine 3-dehydrogenase